MENKTQEELLLTDEEIRVTKAEAERLSWTHKAHPSYEKEKYLLEAQAQISFEAGKQEGIREVVEYLAQNYNRTLYLGGLFQVVITSVEWQAKLKSWGVENGQE